MNRLRATKSLALAVGAWLALTGCASDGYLLHDAGDEDGAPPDGGKSDSPAGDASRGPGDATAEAAATKDSGAGTGSDGAGGQDGAPPDDAQSGDGESIEDALRADGTIADGGEADAEPDSTTQMDAFSGDAADGSAAEDGGAPADATTDSAPADAATANDGGSSADTTAPADAASFADATQPSDASGASDATADASQAADAADAGPSVLSLAAGGSHACALFSDGTIKCWGLNGNGQLGDGYESNSAYPVQVKNLSGPAMAIGAGTFHTCAVISGGTVECWGNGGDGLHGNGTNSGNADLPTPVSAITNATAVVGGYDFSCALLADKTAMCWGFNQAGEVGAGQTGGSFNTPQPVSNVRNAISLAAGFEHACVATSDATNNVACWGNNFYGQLGPATVAQQTGTAVRLTIPGASAVTANFTSSCALTSAGSAGCWGGINDPVDAGGVANLTGATQFNGGPDSTGGICAVVTGGQIACWGTTAGGAQIVPGLSGVRQVVVGNGFTCALLAGTNVVCWGNDAQGQLGDGMPATSSATPVAVQW
jgi:hypothetical protein